MSDRERFEKGFLLNDKQRRYLEAARWFRQEEPRAEGRTTLQAYVIIEEALKHPGERIRISADHSVNTQSVRRTADLIPEAIKRMFRTNRLDDFNGRYDMDQETLVIYPWVCGLCYHTESEHIAHKPTSASITRLKCPFAATYFAKAFVGQKKDGRWVPRPDHRHDRRTGPTWLDGEKNDSRDL